MDLVDVVVVFSFMVLMRPATYTWRWRALVSWTLQSRSSFLMRAAVFLWVMNLEAWTLSTRSFSSGSSKSRLAT